MPVFKRDLFISYAHIDNQPVSADQAGWISRFHAALQTLLSMRLGKDVRIWRDDKLQGNDRFTEEIVDQFSQSAVLISVLTPRYLNSEWCTREVSEFCQHANQDGGLFVDRKARVFKILKTPVDTEATLPPIMRELLGYEFFTLEDGVPMELDAVFGERFGQDFNRKVNKLAFEIAELLRVLDSATDTTTKDVIEVDSQPGPVIYLAQCSFELKDLRETLESELRCLGYEVLPDRHMPRDESGYVEAVGECLRHSHLSVHLVGSYSGAIADGPGNKSLSVLQNETAARYCQSTDLKRIIWLEAGTSSDQQDQQAFIDRLHTDPSAQYGADLISGDQDGLKSAIHAALAGIESGMAPESTLPTESDALEKQVYLICAEQDRKATVPLRKYLRSQGLSVSMPAFQGDANEVRQSNRHLLGTCDLVIVFYGQGDEAWKRSVDTELRKLPGYLDGRPSPPAYTYLAPPASVDKEDLVDMEEPRLINGLAGFSEVELNSCLQRLQPQESAL